MNYPVWELGFGSGLLIAVVAILHVFVSHFAIGGGFFLTLTEYYAVFHDDRELFGYLKLHSRFFALLTLVFGALTGVGIWFTIGLINPAATSTLIHTFVWIWAIEWIFFLTEVAAAVVYYSTWDRIPREAHFIVGWIYFISAFLSLVFINGILTFMLTPGNWLESRDVWEGFFNPTFLPSLFSRMSLCIALAGIYALLTGAFVKNTALKTRLVRYAGVWILAGILGAIPSYTFYYTRLPLRVNELFGGVLPTSLTSVHVLAGGGVILLVLSLVPVIFPRGFRFSMALIFALLGLTVFGASEFVRESVRKPYTINGYLLGNSLRWDEYDTLAKNGGILANALWVRNRVARPTVEAGEDVFRVACRNCHALDGYKGLREPLNALNTRFVADVIARLEHLRGKMPPFPGNDTEREALARYLIAQTDTTARASSGEEVFKKRCSICHTRDREFRGLKGLLRHHTDTSLKRRIPTLGSMERRMAPWSGTPEEAEMLARYVMSWYTADSTGDR